MTGVDVGRRLGLVLRLVVGNQAGQERKGGDKQRAGQGLEALKDPDWARDNLGTPPIWIR